MSAFDMDEFRMLFAGRWTATGLADAISGIDRDELINEYREAIRRAPSRADRGKSYFVDSRTGHLSGADSSNRFEEHLAIALWNLGGDWPRPGGGRTRLLDYQFPLKSRQQDRVGKVDLVGVTEAGRLVVIELKVKPKGQNDRGVTPVRALMQALGYAAIAHANRAAIAAEAKERFDAAISGDPPIVQLLTPKAWWKGWTEMVKPTRNAAGAWEPAFAELIQDVRRQLGVGVECLALADVGPANIGSGPDGRWPCLPRAPALCPVTGKYFRIGEALPPHRSGEER